MLLDALFARVPSVRARLFLLTAILCLLMAALAVAGMVLLGQSNDSLRTVYDDRVVPLQQLKTVSDLYAVNIVDTTHKLRLKQLGADESRRLIEAAGHQVQATWQAYTATYLVAQEKLLVAQIEPLMQAAESLRQELLAATGNEAALELLARTRLYQTIDPLTDKLNALVELQLQVARQEYEQGLDRYASARLAAWLGLAGASTLGLLVAALITSRIMRSLGAEPSAVREIAQGIAGGALNQQVLLRQGDKSSVMAFMSSMQRGLAGLVGEVRANVDELNAASGQIAQGNLDLSGRTEETAATTQRASARLDEVMQRLRSRIGNAADARGLAENARAVAHQAGSQMAEVISAMHGIDDSARRIVDIIATIDGIAFQTNILALNAAVEAARAGDSGRGFAVVASEVRALAQRSATAAREIKGLIAAGPTERTAGGSQQVDATGQTLQKMVTRDRAARRPDAEPGPELGPRQRGHHRAAIAGARAGPRGPAERGPGGRDGRLQRAAEGPGRPPGAGGAGVQRLSGAGVARCHPMQASRQAQEKQALQRRLASSCQPLPAGGQVLHLDGRAIGWLSPAPAERLLETWPALQRLDGGLYWQGQGRDAATLSAEIGTVALRLRDQGLIKGWRNEFYRCEARPLDARRGRALFRLERAAFRFFGLRSRAVHVNGWTPAGRLVCGRRALSKATDPGALDNTAAGGLGADEAPLVCARRELFEEAGLPIEHSRKLQWRGLIHSRRLEDGGLHDELLHVYALQLPAGFEACNGDGEVSEFLSLTPTELRARLAEFSPDAAAVVCLELLLHHR